jgi:hypothetical protein
VKFDASINLQSVAEYKPQFTIAIELLILVNLIAKAEPFHKLLIIQFLSLKLQT